MISYFSKNPDGLARVRTELENKVSEMVKEDASLRGVDKKELLKRVVTLETCSEQEFLSTVI